MICVECNKFIMPGTGEGSSKHPYCKKCFKKVWNNDYNKYCDFVLNTHIG